MGIASLGAGRLRPYGRGGRWAKRSTTVQKLYPSLAAAVSASNSGAAAWGWSAYTQIVAAVAADFYPVMAYQRLLVQPQTSGTKRFVYEIELAKGAAGSEVTIARWSDALMAAITTFNANDHATYGYSVPVGPALVASGTRLAFRIRGELIATDVLLTAHICIGGYESLAPDSDPTYPLDEHLRGDATPTLLATPTGSTLSVPTSAFPTYGAWLQVWASAAADSLVWGIEGYISTGVTNTGRHIQFGIGAAGSEVVYELIGAPVATGIGAGRYLMRRPLLVLAGERLAVRQSGGGVGNWSSQVLHEDL